MKNDKELQRNVLDELECEPIADAADIGVSVGAGVVTLTGTVKSLPEKWAAERAAQRVLGVKAVANDIEVKLPGASERTDADIALAAAKTLEWNVSVPHDRVKITVDHCWINLAGTVDWQYQKIAAEKAVHSLYGVKGVSNLINVKPWVTSGEIETMIEKALMRSAEVDAQRIQVEFHNGKVVLSGKVQSWLEREEAERTVWSAPGVSEVQNNITVGA